jgi:hypothetical protein
VSREGNRDARGSGWRVATCEACFHTSYPFSLSNATTTRASHEIAALRALTQRDLVEFFTAFTAAGSVGRRAFISLVDPGTEAPAGGAGEEEGEGGEDDDGDEAEEDAEDGGDAPAPAAAVSAAATGSSVAREDRLAPDPLAPPAEAEPPSPVVPQSADALLALLPPPRSEIVLDLTLEQALRVQAAAASHGFALSRSRADALAALLGFCDEAGVPLAGRLRSAVASGNTCIVVRCRTAVPSTDVLRASLAYFPVLVPVAVCGAE